MTQPSKSQCNCGCKEGKPTADFAGEGVMRLLDMEQPGTVFYVPCDPRCGQPHPTPNDPHDNWQTEFVDLFVYTDFMDENVVPVRRDWRPTFQLPDREIAAIKHFIHTLLSRQRGSIELSNKNFIENLQSEFAIEIASVASKERECILEKILDKIDNDYDGRDITIYELGHWIREDLKKELV